MVEDLVEFMRTEIPGALTGELPVFPPEQWLKALVKLVAGRAGPGTAVQQVQMLPELGALSRTIRFEFGETGVKVAADGSAQLVLTRLRRGSLWFKGGDPEAELIALLDEAGS